MAKFWAADGGQRVVHAAVHLHGGVGVDREYPLHRYFLNTKHIELTLGGATDQLLRWVRPWRPSRPERSRGSEPAGAAIALSRIAIDAGGGRR